MSETIGEAYIRIMPSADEFESGLSSSLSGLGSVADEIGSAIGEAIAVGLESVTALVSAVSDLASAGDSISKTAQKLGVSTDFYQEWDAVLQHSGTSISAVSGVFRKLATESQSASDDQIEAFQKLGFSMEEVASMSQEDLFSGIITSLQSMEAGNERTAIAMTLFGRSATELAPLLNTSAEDTQAMIDRVHELGGVLDETALKDSENFQDMLQDMNTSLTGLGNSILSQFLPNLSLVMDGVTEFALGNEDGLSMINEGIQGVLTTISEGMPQFLEIAVTVIEGLAEALITNIPLLVDSAFNIIDGLITFIMDNLPMLVQTAVDIINRLAEYLLQNLPMLIQAGMQIVLQLASSIGESLPTLIPTIVEIVLEIVNTLIDNIDLLIDAAIQLMIGLAKGLVQAIPKIIAKIPQIIKSIVAEIVRNLPTILAAGIDIVLELAKGLVQAIPQLVSNVPQIISAIVEGFKSGVESIKGIGGDMIRGLWDGISDKSDWIIQQIQGFGDSVLAGLKDFFGIASPSKVMAEQVGRFLPEGMALGIEANADSVTDAMDNIASRTLNVATTLPNALATNRYNLSEMKSESNEIMDLLEKYLPVIAQNDSGVVIEADADRMFNVMRKKNAQFTKQTGRSAF